MSDRAKPVGRFPASARVRKRSEFREIQSKGRRITTQHCILLLRARDAATGDETITGSRLGITASRKVGNAITRNRAKRLVREAFRATRELWHSDIDLVVIVRRPMELKLSDLVREWHDVAALIERRTASARRDRNRGEVARGS